MSVLLPLRIWRGQTRTYRFTVYDASSGNPLNLDVYDDIEFQVKTDIETADPPLIFKSLGLGGVIKLTQSGATVGKMDVLCAPGDTSGVSTPIGIYKYDLFGIIGTARYLLAKPADFVIEGVVNQA